MKAGARGGRSATRDLLTPAQQRDFARARLAATWVGLVWPLVVTVIALTLTLVWLPELPSTVALHWGPGDQPDGFGPAWAYPVLTGALGIALTLLMWAMVVGGSRGGAFPVWSPTQRFMAAFAAGLISFLQVSLTWSLAVQRGLEDAREAPAIGGVMLIALAFGMILGGLGWFVQPAVRIDGPLPTPMTPIPLAPGERAVWVGVVRPARSLFVGVALGTLVMTVAALTMYIAGAQAWWAVALIAALMLALGMCSLWFRVRVDRDGLEVRSTAGFPAFRVPITAITSAQVGEVHPLADFGGWGLRWAPGRFGVVMRAGEALVVTRTAGRQVVVTVDDAHTAAALLETYRLSGNDRAAADPRTPPHRSEHDAE